jgi:hypothetical protein
MSGIPIARNGEAAVSLVIGCDAPCFFRWLAEELQHYLFRLSGAVCPIVEAGREEDVPVAGILIGTPSEHAGIRDLQRGGGFDPASLTVDGFVLNTFMRGGRPILVAGGSGERGAMYAVYDLLERLGVIFLLSGDILPEPSKDLEIPEMDVRSEPLVRRRGLHMRHFVMPWMGLEDFCRLVDQMAKMKCNYLEFYWYEGGPWVRYAHGGTERKIGDLYPREAGYVAWRSESYSFSAMDATTARDALPFPRPCAEEFQECDTPEAAHDVARELLRKMIRHAHARGLEIWLGAGDCPTVPPNLGRDCRTAVDAGSFGFMIPPGDSVGVEIWTAILESMFEIYPEADGYWLWLAESYFDSRDVRTVEVLQRLDGLRDLMPDRNRLAEMGYDQYLENLEDERILLGDLSLVHYACEVLGNMRRRHPEIGLGASLLGRSYLFPILHASLPMDIRLQSMEASPCWNRRSRVPMRNFGGMDGREIFLVPRLDDDENAFALQCNVGLYEHDQVLEGSVLYGVAGIAAQIGKIRGSEQNAAYLMEGCWRPNSSADAFYDSYAGRVFGKVAGPVVADVYRRLDRIELDLGLRADVREAGPCLQGMGNFLNYADSRDVHWMKGYRRIPPPGARESGFGAHGDLKDPPFLQRLAYRTRAFMQAVERFHGALAHTEEARRTARPESLPELAFLQAKIHAFCLHLETCSEVMRGLAGLESAYAEPSEDLVASALSQSAEAFADALERAVRTAEALAACAAHPGERHLLFRYDVRMILPIREFGRHVGNLLHRSGSGLEGSPPNWDIIDPGG